MDEAEEAALPQKLMSIAIDAFHSLAYARNLMIAVFRQTPTADRITRMDEMTRKMYAATGCPLGVFVRVHKDCGVPQGEPRLRIQEYLAAMADMTVGWAIVHENTSSWGNAQRATTASIYALSGGRINLKMFYDVGEGAGWLAGVMQARRIGNPPLVRDDITAYVARLG
jgi:hypothetical protein